MNAEKLSHIRKWIKGLPPLAGRGGPFEVQERQLARGWAHEAQSFHADTIEHRAMIGNLEAGVRELVEHVGTLEAANVEARMLLRKAYAPLRNAHRKAKPSHRDVVEWSSNTKWCETCAVLFKMQEEIERVAPEGLPNVALMNERCLPEHRKAGAR